MIPTAEEQLDFLQKIQLILEAGDFTSTYKYALLLSLVNLSIIQGNDTAQPLQLSYQDIAEQFILQYWKQSLPYEHIEQKNFILQQNTGPQIVAIQKIQKLMANHTTLPQAMKSKEWQSVIKSIAETIKKYPAKLLQNIEGQSLNFLYDWQSSGSTILLKRNVMFCFRQFNGIIRQLVQQNWSDFVRLLPKNKEILKGQPDIQSFLFDEQRTSLKKVGSIYQELQENRCFYCDQPIKNDAEVDHFIPWSYYQQDTIHNFVIADKKCNGAKSNFLADIHFLEKWLERNAQYGEIIHEATDDIGIISNLISSENIAQWAYQRAHDQQSPIWIPPKEFTVINQLDDVTKLFTT